MTDTKQIGDIVQVKNPDKKLGPATEYFFTKVKWDNGLDIPLLFTHHEITEAMDRAIRNSKVLPKVFWKTIK